MPKARNAEGRIRLRYDDLTTGIMSELLNLDVMDTDRNATITRDDCFIERISVGKNSSVLWASVGPDF